MTDPPYTAEGAAAVPLAGDRGDGRPGRRRVPLVRIAPAGRPVRAPADDCADGARDPCAHARLQRLRRRRRARRHKPPLPPGNDRGSASRSCAAASRVRSTRRLEEELPPRSPPVVGTRADLARVRDLDARAVAVLLDVIRGVEVDDDLARPSRGRTARTASRSASACFAPASISSRALWRRKLTRTEAAEALLHGDGRQSVAEQRACPRGRTPRRR